MDIVRNADGRPTIIRMRKPADMHHHLRRGAMLRAVVPMLAKRFALAIVMPNTLPDLITNVDAVRLYRAEIAAALATADHCFAPLMTLYLTDTLDPADVAFCVPGEAVGIKYYPRGLTTNSDNGVADPASLWTRGTVPFETLRILAAQGGVFLLHAADGVDRYGEVIDPYDQERHFLRETLPRIIDAHPELKISIEHLSTAVGAAFM